MKKLIEMTVGEMFDATVSKFPHKQAVKYIEMDFDKTYLQLSHEVDTFSKSLLALGFKKGDHIAVWATNYPEWIVLLLATAKIGVILVTVNTSYKTAEFKYVMNQSESKGLFICDGLKDIDCEQTIYALCPEMEVQEAGKLDLKELPFLKTVVSFDNKYDGMFYWKEIRKFAREISNEEYQKAKDQVGMHDVVNMQYTSGTTGFPKGVMLTHYNIVNNGKSIGDSMNFDENDRLCIPVPFFHCFGLVLAIMACLTHGTTMIPLLYYTPMKTMHAIHYEKCTAVHGVPTMFIAMLEHRDFSRYRFTSLRTGIMAGSPCPEAVMKKVVEKMNMKDITIAYGQTELSPVCTQTVITDSLEKRVQTVGRALPFIETKIVDTETGNEVAVNQPGEFCARGYNVMKGYFNMEKETANAIDADGWLHTGDIATVDEEGYYRITGRLKDMIIRGGENIYPKEIEEFIYTYEKVQDVQVVGMKSEKYGEEVAAFVIAKKDQELTAEEIKHYIRENMARHKVPKQVNIVDSFPMTASGKIQKYILREMADNK